MAQLHELTAVELRQALLSRAASSHDIVSHYLERIDAHNATLGPFTTITADIALDKAKQADHVLAIGKETGILHGLPLADKDLSARLGVPTGYGSRAAPTTPATESDEIVLRTDASGAISLGKTTTPEFGLTCYTRNHRATALGQPQTKNPYDLRLDPGGSSGGAAVAVAAHLLPFAPGSDGGGSIRIPASATGLVGLKPTRSLIPNGPEMVGRLAVPGPLARTTADTALLLSGLVDPIGDIDALGYLAAAHRIPEPGVRVGVLTDSPWRDLVEVAVDPAVSQALDHAITLLESAGHSVQPIPRLNDTGFADAFITAWQYNTAQIPVAGAEHVLEPLTRWLHAQGQRITDTDVHAALTWFAEFEASTTALFDTYDLILTPTLGMLPQPIEWFDDENPEVNFTQQCQFAAFTSFANVAGLPAINVPVTMATNELGSEVPVGVQLIGPVFSESTLLSISAQVEQLRGPFPGPPMLVADSSHM